MKVALVEAFGLPYSEPNDHGNMRSICMVKVTTDDGAVGWGEAVTLFDEATRATMSIVQGLQPHLVGIEATPRAVREAIHGRSWWYGFSGIATFAAAAIDIALWDLQGRAQSRSLADLLGGTVHDSLTTITSCHATLADIGEMTHVMAEWVGAADSAGIKVGFGKAGLANLGFDRTRDLTFVRSLRRALGDDARIMIDIGARIRWTVDEAIDRTLAFEEYDIDWIEEPLGADNPAGYAQFKAATSTRIAYGEREWTVRGIERIVDTGTVDVVGIDPGRAEGVSGFSAAASFIASRGVEANAHAFAGPITYAASLALSLTTPACKQLEVPPYLNQLYDIVGVPERPVDGHVRVSTLPGLGFEIDEIAVREHSWS